MKKQTLFAAVAVALALAMAASEAKASFTYSVTTTPTTVNFGAGNTSTYTISPAFGPPPAASGVLAGNQIINLVQTTQTSSRTVGTDTTSFTSTLTVQINNIESGLSSSFTVNGTINVTRSDTGGAISNFVLNSILPPTITLGSFTYSLGTPTYSAPTIQGGVNANGGISILITEVPEPASVALMGLGVVALGGLAVYRRRRAA